VGLPLLFRSRHYVIVDKPAGLLSVGDARAGQPGVAEVLAQEGLRGLAVHRLDRDVSGALLVALEEEAREALQDLFRQRVVHKVYWALASGTGLPARGRWTDPILEERGTARVSARGKPARTIFRVLERHGACTELEIDLETGRKNQIRVHAAHAGAPLVGERRYARGRDSALRARRLALHAWRLSFRDPWSGEEVAVEAPLPADLSELRQRAAGRSDGRT
jgi:RluA family pseudouridine synthase